MTGEYAKIQQDLITTTSRVRVRLASNGVGLTPRRACKKQITPKHDGCHCKVSNPFSTQEKNESKLFVVHMQHVMVELLLSQLLCLCNMQRRR
jgi:hypothetical protein